MDVFVIFTTTSNGPGSGFSISSISKPGEAEFLTIAFNSYLSFRLIVTTI